MKLNSGVLTAVLFSVFALSVTHAQTKTPPTAQSVVSAAVKTAATQDKAVLVRFGASWCSWCKRLDALVEGPEFGKLFADNYVLPYLTIQESDDKKALENPGAQAMVNEAKAGGGVPVYIFLDKTGKILATSGAMPNGGNIGHPATPEEIKAFDGLLAKTAPRMTAAQRAQIVEYLSKQKL